ncbi:MAG: helix-turn-helix transcriptional regulator, partial [Clostridia bacterium]|nr:helix-turn-helix transcriptional regulator [Clostridia bacterium]
KELKYSPSYIRYIFKREGNVSVQAKINEIRLNKAKRLLRGGMMSITDIAFAVGFTDSNYFSTVFKKIEKISPSEYRKNLSR